LLLLYRRSYWCFL